MYIYFKKIFVVILFIHLFVISFILWVGYHLFTLVLRRLNFSLLPTENTTAFIVARVLICFQLKQFQTWEELKRQSFLWDQWKIFWQFANFLLQSASNVS